MPDSSASSPRKQLRPLSDDERAGAQRIGDRLRAELESLLMVLPAHVRGGAALARLLGVDRSTCQRIIAAVGRRADALDVLRRAPGPDGLGRFIDAMKSHGASAELVRRARSAVEAFAGLIEELAGSQAALIRRLSTAARAEGGVIDEETEEAFREQAFEATAALTRRSVQTQANVVIMRPLPEDHSRAEVVTARRYVQLQCRPGAPPVSGIFFARADDELPTGQPRPVTLRPGDGEQQGTLIPEFTTSPPPTISSRAVGDVTLQLLEPPSGTPDPFDATIAYRLSPSILHPALQEDRRLELYHHCVIPTGTLVLYVYLHRSMASRCITSATLHQRPAELPHDATGTWFDRLDHRLRIEVLGNDLRAAEHPSVPRQVDLLSHLFDAVDWDRGEFVGYRLVVPFPLWSCCYTVSFDFEAP